MPYENLFKKYFGAEYSYAMKVAKAESGLRANAHNYNPKTKDNSYGLMQINIYGSLAKSRPSGEWLLNPENNIAYAKQLRDSSGWNCWSTVKNGKVK